MKWRERVYWIVAGIMLLVFLKACGEGCRIFSKRPQEVIKIEYDTVYVSVKSDTVYQPIPTTKYQYITRNKYDTLYEFEVRIDPVDTAMILADYYSTYLYSDTQKIKYGTIVVNDTITENKILRRGLKTNLSIPEVTKTVTLTQPKRTIGYIGFSALGSPQQPLHSLGADLSFKLKSDYIFGVGANFTKDGQMFYSGQFKIPIRLKK